jgi:molecular chaperone DnaK
MAVVGIDLGTTFSVVAYVDKTGTPKPLENKEGSLITPSVIFVQDEEYISVGAQALNSSAAFPEQTVEFAKNEMGNKKNYTIKGKTFSPEHISSLILKKLIQDAEQELDEKITGAVITVPAIFGEAQRYATKQAAKLANLEVLSILNEPEAAAICYGVTKMDATDKDRYILVYDLGGGTFDISVLHISNGFIKVLLTDGNRTLGGKDWDSSIIDYMAESFVKEHGIDPREDTETRQKLRIEAEDVKRKLSDMGKIPINVVYQNKNHRLELSRQTFEEITAQHLKKTEIKTRQTIEHLIDKKILKGWEDIDQVLLVGGSSVMPQVRGMIERLSGKMPLLFKPHLAVALGAALYAVLQVLPKDDLRPTEEETEAVKRHKITPEDYVSLTRFTPTSVCSFAIGCKLTTDDPNEGFRSPESSSDFYVNEIIIQKNTPLPAKGKIFPVTRFENQKSILIEILEGELKDPISCTKLGAGVINNLPPLPKGTPVEVTVELSDESLVECSARVPSVPNSEIQITINREKTSNIDFDLVKADVTQSKVF